MPLSNHLSFVSTIPDKSQAVFAGDMARRDGGAKEALDSPFPFGPRVRDSLAVVSLLIVLACFWKPLVELYSLARIHEHYSHIFLIPLLSLYAFYADRKSILMSKQWSPWLGLSLSAAGAWGYWWAGSEASGIDDLSMSSVTLVMICWGIFLTYYGIKSCRTFSFGLLILLFMVPLPAFLLEAVIGFLQRLSTEATQLFFSILGVPVFREGFVFSLSNITIHVAEECSGIRSALALFITSLVAGHFFLQSTWGKLSVVAIVVPLAIIKNAFRIVGLALLANYVDPTFITDSALHRGGGIPLFLLSLIVLFSFVWLIRRVEGTQGRELPGRQEALR